MSALAIDPVYVKALCRRAMAREKMGKLPEALLDLTAACMLSGFQNEMGARPARARVERGRLTRAAPGDSNDKHRPPDQGGRPRQGGSEA